jgi:cytochrome c553
MPLGWFKLMACGIAAWLMAAALAPQTADAAGDAKAGRKKAILCQACHGLDGIAKLPDSANLAGQNPVYLTKALKDFRAGIRKNELMSMVAPMLNDADIDNLAAYYSGIKITVAPPK